MKAFKYTVPALSCLTSSVTYPQVNYNVVLPFAGSVLIGAVVVVLIVIAIDVLIVCRREEARKRRIARKYAKIKWRLKHDTDKLR